jgi:ligand-binding sensor domain-containing protein
MRPAIFHFFLIVHVMFAALTLSSCKKKKNNTFPAPAGVEDTVAIWTLINDPGGMYSYITDIEQRGSGDVWIASVNGTTAPFTSKISACNAFLVIGQTIDSSTSSFLNSNVTSIGFDPLMNLHFGTQFYNTPGLSKELIVVSGGNFTHYTTPGGTAYNFENFYFNSDGLWFGTGNTGLLNFDEPDFVTYNSWNSGIPYPNYVSDLVRIDNEDFWIGTAVGLVRKTGTTFTQVIDYTPIDAMAPDSQGNLWMAGGVEPTLYRFDGSDTTNYPIPVTGGIGLEVADLAVDSYDNIWVATNVNGLFKFNGTTWVHYLPSNSQLHSAYLTALKADAQGNLWIGSTDTGVMRLNKFGTGN